MTLVKKNSEDQLTVATETRPCPLLTSPARKFMQEVGHHGAPGGSPRHCVNLSHGLGLSQIFHRPVMTYVEQVNPMQSEDEGLPNVPSRPKRTPTNEAVRNDKKLKSKNLTCVIKGDCRPRAATNNIIDKFEQAKERSCAYKNQKKSKINAGEENEQSNNSIGDLEEFQLMRANSSFIPLGTIASHSEIKMVHDFDQLLRTSGHSKFPFGKPEQRRMTCPVEVFMTDK